MVIQSLCDFTVIIESYVEGRWTARTASTIIDQRNYVQHRLMSLPTKQELDDGGVMDVDPLYESCRLATIAYSFLVVFPLPPVIGPFEAVAAELRQELLTVHLEFQDSSTAQLVLWITVMGGIAALGLPERLWFRSRVNILRAHLGVTSWPELKAVLQQFLWHPSTNDPDGREFLEDELPDLGELQST